MYSVLCSGILKQMVFYYILVLFLLIHILNVHTCCYVCIFALLLIADWYSIFHLFSLPYYLLLPITTNNPITNILTHIAEWICVTVSLRCIAESRTAGSWNIVILI